MGGVRADDAPRQPRDAADRSAEALSVAKKRDDEGEESREDDERTSAGQLERAAGALAPAGVMSTRLSAPARRR